MATKKVASIPARASTPVRGQQALCYAHDTDLRMCQGLSGLVLDCLQLYYSLFSYKINI